MTDDLENRAAAITLTRAVLDQLPAELNTAAVLRPVMAHENRLLTADDHVYVLLADDSVARVVELANGGHEVTRWKAGVELERYVQLEQPECP